MGPLDAYELAAVLAFIASHDEQGHTLRKLIESLGWRATLGASLGNFSSSIWNDMGEHLLKIKYGIDMEREVDAEALRMLRRAGVSADGVLPFFNRMAERVAVTPGIRDAHDFSQARIVALGELIASQPDYQSRLLPVDWIKFKNSISIISVR